MHDSRNIYQQALELKPAEKYYLIESLLKSLDEPDKSIDEIWNREAESRLKAFREGRSKALTFDDIFGQKP